MKRNYVVFTQHLFTARDWVRFDCKVMAKRGYKVRIVQCGEALAGLDLSVLARGDFQSVEQAETPKTKSNIQVILDGLSTRDLIISLLPLTSNATWLYREFGRRNLHYVTVSLGRLPTSPNCWLIAHRSIMKALLCFAQSVWHFSFRVKAHLGLLLDIGPAYFLVPAPLFWVRAGSFRRFFAMDGIHLWRSEVVEAESFEIGWFKLAQLKNVPVADGPYAVFIDEAMRDHPDFEICDIPLPINETSYYSGLCSFFDVVERDLGLEVVVAVHPKASYLPSELDSLFGHRRVIEKNTPALIHDADLVFAHNSTAVSYAALFRKPVIFLTNGDIEKSYIQYDMEMRSSWLEQPIINIDLLNDERGDLISIPEVNEKIYSGYVRNFLRAPSAKSGFLSEVIADKFESHTKVGN